MAKKNESNFKTQSQREFNNSILKAYLSNRSKDQIEWVRRMKRIYSLKFLEMLAVHPPVEDKTLRSRFDKIWADIESLGDDFAIKYEQDQATYNRVRAITFLTKKYKELRDPKSSTRFRKFPDSILTELLARLEIQTTDEKKIKDAQSIICRSKFELRMLRASENSEKRQDLIEGAIKQGDVGVAAFNIQEMIAKNFRTHVQYEVRMLHQAYRNILKAKKYAPGTFFAKYGELLGSLPKSVIS